MKTILSLLALCLHLSIQAQSVSYTKPETDQIHWMLYSNRYQAPSHSRLPAATPFYDMQVHDRTGKIALTPKRNKRITRFHIAHGTTDWTRLSDDAMWELGMELGWRRLMQDHPEYLPSDDMRQPIRYDPYYSTGTGGYLDLLYMGFLIGTSIAR